MLIPSGVTPYTLEATAPSVKRLNGRAERRGGDLGGRRAGGDDGRLEAEVESRADVVGLQPGQGAGAADAARGDEHLVDVSCPAEDFREGLLVSAVTGNVQHGVVGILSQARAVHPGESGLQPVGVAGGSRADGPGGTPAARAAGSRIGPRAVRPAMMAARAQVSSVIAERRNSMSCLTPTGTVQVRRVSDARRKPKPRMR